MDRNNFAKKVLRLKSRQQWDYVLAGERNLKYSRAKIAAAVLGTSTDIWQDRGLVLERQAAWSRYANEEQKTKEAA